MAFRSSKSVTSDDRIGQTVSHYRIVEKLGGGGMGVVCGTSLVRVS